MNYEVRWEERTTDSFSVWGRGYSLEFRDAQGS